MTYKQILEKRALHQFRTPEIYVNAVQEYNRQLRILRSAMHSKDPIVNWALALAAGMDIYYDSPKSCVDDCIRSAFAKFNIDPRLLQVSSILTTWPNDLWDWIDEVLANADVSTVQ